MKFTLPSYLMLMMGLVLTGFLLMSAEAPTSSSLPPTGYTGANGSYCNSCHGGNTRNAAGGSVVISGLPSSNYSASATYNFSLTITHATANRTRWGFSIIAVNSAGASVGSFSSMNTNAVINGNELSHKSAPSTPQQSSYTFNNLKWTAPASTTGNNQAVTFYFVGNAANGSGTSGDFIYSASKTLVASGTLPVSISGFTAACNMGTPDLAWTGENETDVVEYHIEKSTDGSHFSTASTIARGVNDFRNQYHFTDAGNQQQSGQLYYRIAALETNGATYLSDIKNICMDADQANLQLRLFPNPARPGSRIYLQMDHLESSGTLNLRLTNLFGSVMADYRIGMQAGVLVDYIELPLQLTPGMYYLLVPGSRKNKGLPLLVQ